MTDSGGNVNVIDTATNKIVNTVRVGGAPGGVAVMPDGIGVYVPNVTGDYVSVIEAFLMTVVANVPVGNGPTGGIAISPDGTRAYETIYNNLDLSRATNEVVVINTATSKVIKTIHIDGDPGAVAVSPDGAHVYVAVTAAGAAAQHNLSVIDTATNAIAKTIPLGFSDPPSGVAITPDGRDAYVTEANTCPALGSPNGHVSVINIKTDKVRTTLSGIGCANGGVVINPSGTRAYMPGIDNGAKLWVINTATNKIATTVTLNPDSSTSAPGGVAITPDGASVYVTNNLGRRGSNVWVIDTATKAVSSIPFPKSAPWAVATGQRPRPSLMPGSKGPCLNPKDCPPKTKP